MALTKKQKAEKALRDAEAALQADPDNGELKQAVRDAEAALAKLQPKPAAPKKVAALEVTCRKAEFWRVGRKWTKEPVTVALDSFTEEQIEQLKAEPMLIITEVEIEA